MKLDHIQQNAYIHLEVAYYLIRIRTMLNEHIATPKTKTDNENAKVIHI